MSERPTPSAEINTPPKAFLLLYKYRTLTSSYFLTVSVPHSFLRVLFFSFSTFFSSVFLPPLILFFLQHSSLVFHFIPIILSSISSTFNDLSLSESLVTSGSCPPHTLKSAALWLWLLMSQ